MTPNVKLVHMEKCTGYPHLHQLLAIIAAKVLSFINGMIFMHMLKQGGEGVVLRQPGTLYEAGYRSDSMLKFKVYSSCCASLP